MRLLLIEDERELARVLRQALVEEGFPGLYSGFRGPEIGVGKAADVAPLGAGGIG